MKQFKSLFKKLVVSAVMFSAITLAGFVMTSSVTSFAQNGIETFGTKVCSGVDKSGALVAANCPLVNLNPNDNRPVPLKIASFILSIARVITYIAGAIAVIVIVISGVQRMNSADADAAKKSNERITQAAIGLAVAVLAYTIVGVLSAFLVGNFFGDVAPTTGPASISTTT